MAGTCMLIISPAAAQVVTSPQCEAGGGGGCRACAPCPRRTRRLLPARPSPPLPPLWPLPPLRHHSARSPAWTGPTHHPQLSPSYRIATIDPKTQIFMLQTKSQQMDLIH